MRPPSPTSLRRLGAAVLLPLTLALSACGARYDLVIHTNDTADLAILLWDSQGDMTEADCTEETMGTSDSELPEGAEVTYTFTQYQGNPACEMKATNVPLSEFDGSDDSMKITHEDGKYVFVQPASSFEGYDSGLYGDLEMVYTVTFPGKVTEHSGNSTVDGNTVTWSDVLAEPQDLRAVGKDSDFNPLILIIGAVVGLVVIGGVAAIIVVSRKKKAGVPVPTGEMPGQPGYQQPGHQAQQPGQYPSSPQQPPSPGSQY